MHYIIFMELIWLLKSMSSICWESSYVSQLYANKSELGVKHGYTTWLLRVDYVMFKTEGNNLVNFVSACENPQIAPKPRFSKLDQEWPWQTKPKKGQFMNFSQVHSGTKVRDVNRACFPKEQTRIHKKGRNSRTFRFGPFFGLVCRGETSLN